MDFSFGNRFVIPNFIKSIQIRIAVPSTILNTGARNTFGGGGRRDGRGGGEGGLGGLGGRGGLGGHGGVGVLGGSARDEFEFSSWPTPSSHCSQSMAAAAKEKVIALVKRLQVVFLDTQVSLAPTHVSW